MKSKYFLLYVEDATYTKDNVVKPYFNYYLVDADGKVTVRSGGTRYVPDIEEQVLGLHPRVEITLKEISGTNKDTNQAYNYLKLTDLKSL